MNCVCTLSILGGTRPSPVARSQTINAQLTVPTGLVDVHTHAIDADLPDLRRAYPHDRWPASSAPARPKRSSFSVDSPTAPSITGAGHQKLRIVDMDREGVADAGAFPNSGYVLLYRIGGRHCRTGGSAKRVFTRITHHPSPLRCAGRRRLCRTLTEPSTRCAGHAPRGPFRRRDRHAGGATELADPSLDRFFAVGMTRRLVLVHPTDQDLPLRVIGNGDQPRYRDANRDSTHGRGD